MAHLLGLRIDVDTHQGMRDGVPRLLDLLGKAGVRGTFYLAMGPDRSGLALANVFTQPGFLAKLWRSGAPGIYSLRTLLSGTLLPSRPVGTGFPDHLRRADREGHETGVHGWDHRRWQDRLHRFSKEEIADELDRGARAYEAILGRRPGTFAAPAWRSCGESLRHQEGLGLAYASDCRGTEPFLPILAKDLLTTPQVPTTLPTLDETLGRTDRDAAAFFARVLAQAQAAAWPVLAVHAELEGGPFAPQFAAFLSDAPQAGLQLVPLRELLAARLAAGEPLLHGPLSQGRIEGRSSAVSLQGTP